MLTENRNKCLNPNSTFIVDEACLDIYNNLDYAVNVEGQYNECNNCKFQLWAALQPNESTSVLVNTQYLLELNYTTSDNHTCK